jgi:hypothetical protein
MTNLFILRYTRLASALCMCVLPIVFGAKAAQARESAGGAVFYSASMEPGGPQDIYRAGTDGSTPENLTADFEGSAWAPVASPDGRWVVFGSHQEGNQIWVMAADGSGKRPLAVANQPFDTAMGYWMDNATLVFNADLDAATVWGQPVWFFEGRTYYDWAQGQAIAEDVPFGLVVKVLVKPTAPLESQELLTRPEINLLWVPERVGLGSAAVFRVRATGNPAPAYRWQLNGEDLGENQRVRGVASEVLTIGPVRSEDAGDYGVVVYNSVGTVTSRATRLTVEESTAARAMEPSVAKSADPGKGVDLWVSQSVNRPSRPEKETPENAAGSMVRAAAVTARRAPVIKTQPQSVGVLAGKTASLKVSATGTAPLTYQWQFKGADLVNSRIVMGATTPTLTLKGVTEAMEGEYRVTVSNGAGQVMSQGALVVVGVGPVIVGQPQSRNAIQGQPVSMEVLAQGDPAPGYQWFKNGKKLVDGGRINGALSAVLQIADAQAADAGTYTVEVRNLVGMQKSKPAQLKVLAPPSIVQPPADLKVIAGKKAVFTVKAQGTGPLTYQWYFNGAAVKNGNGISGATTAQLTIGPARAPHEGEYAVEVRNAVGQARSAGARLFLEPPSLTGKWTFKGFQFVSDDGPPYVRDKTIPLNFAQLSELILEVTTPVDARVRVRFDLEGDEWTSHFTGYDYDHDFGDNYYRIRMINDEFGILFVGDTFFKDHTWRDLDFVDSNFGLISRAALRIDNFPWEGEYDVGGYWVESHEDWGNGHVVFEEQRDSIVIKKLSANQYTILSAGDNEPTLLTQVGNQLEVKDTYYNEYGDYVEDKLIIRRAPGQRLYAIRARVVFATNIKNELNFAEFGGYWTSPKR